MVTKSDIPRNDKVKVVIDEPAFTVGDAGFYPLDKGSEGAAGYDVIANISEPVEIIFDKGPVIIPTGVRMEMPFGMAAMVMSRSGLGVKHGVNVAHGVGLVDSDYRGEVIVPLVKTTKGPSVTIRPGDRIAQIVFVPVASPDFDFVDELEESERGEGKFGSTGGVAAPVEDPTRYSAAQPGNAPRRETVAKEPELAAPKGETIPAPNEGKANIIDDGGTGFISPAAAPKGSQKGKKVTERSEGKSDKTAKQPTPQV